MTYFGSLHDLPKQFLAKSRSLDGVASLPTVGITIDNVRDALREAAEAMQQLMRGELPGCTCTRIEHDDYTRLEYDEKCRHHRSLASQLAASKKRYDDAEKKLTNDIHIKLVIGMMPGLLTEAIRTGIISSQAATRMGSTQDELMAGIVQVAIMAADTTIAELLK